MEKVNTDTLKGSIKVKSLGANIGLYSEEGSIGGFEELCSLRNAVKK